MENGLNFGAIEAAKAGKKSGKSRMERSRNFAYIVPASQYPAITGVAKEYWGKETLNRAYWALKTAQEDVATWLLLEAILSLKTGQY
jgi:hypothetical protein